MKRLTVSLRKVFLLVLVIAITQSLPLGEPNSALSNDIPRTPLTSIGAVSSLDAEPDPLDPGTGGGFDQQSYFQNRFIPKLADCTNEMEKAFVDWTKSKKLVLVRREAALGSILIHATRDGIGGLFELSYTVDTKFERARVSVNYFNKDGTAMEPVLIKGLLETWDIADLQDSLDAVIRCNQV